eukprot:12909270-Prorocentrum_lima.AAC.1
MRMAASNGGATLGQSAAASEDLHCDRRRSRQSRNREFGVQNARPIQQVRSLHARENHDNIDHGA